MSERNVKIKTRAQKVYMGGIPIDQPLPSSGIESIDPFLLIHHWKSNFPGEQKQEDLGVSPHPHTGFSPVTLIFEGGLHHRDSMGNDSIVRDGGTQWMNAGKGIVHSERPTKDIAEDGGSFELIQCWINTPADHKYDQPYYKPLSAGDTPRIPSEDGKIELGIVAGKLKEKQSPVKTLSPLLVLRGTGKKGGKISIPVNSGFNVLMYVLDGLFVISDDTRLGEKDMAVFSEEGESLNFQCEQDGKFMILAGQPLNEPIATHGPFVMSSEEEIDKAIDDFRSGKFGVLNENFE